MGGGGGAYILYVFIVQNNSIRTFHTILTKKQTIINSTRQSEMANTSPRHMPVLGNFHPIKIENFDIFA